MSGVNDRKVVQPGRLCGNLPQAGTEGIDSVLGTRSGRPGFQVAGVVGEAHVSGKSTGNKTGQGNRFGHGGEDQGFGCPGRANRVGEGRPDEINVRAANRACTEHRVQNTGNRRTGIDFVLPGGSIRSAVRSAPVEFRSGCGTSVCLQTGIEDG